MMKLKFSKSYNYPQITEGAKNIELVQGDNRRYSLRITYNNGNIVVWKQLGGVYYAQEQKA